MRIYIYKQLMYGRRYKKLNLLTEFFKLNLHKILFKAYKNRFMSNLH